MRVDVGRSTGITGRCTRPLAASLAIVSGDKQLQASLCKCGCDCQITCGDNQHKPTNDHWHWAAGESRAEGERAAGRRVLYSAANWRLKSGFDGHQVFQWAALVGLGASNERLLLLPPGGHPVSCGPAIRFQVQTCPALFRWAASIGCVQG